MAFLILFILPAAIVGYQFAKAFPGTYCLTVIPLALGFFGVFGSTVQGWAAKILAAPITLLSAWLVS